MGAYDDFIARMRATDPMDPANAGAQAVFPPLAATQAARGLINQIPDQRSPETIATGPEAQVSGDPYARVKDAGEIDARKQMAPGPQKVLNAGELDAPRPMPIPAQGIGFGSLDKRVAEEQAKVNADDRKLIADERALTDAKVEENDVGAAAYAAEAQRQQAKIAEQEQIDKAAAVRQQAWIDRSAQLSEDLKSEKLDPNRLYGNASTGTRIALIIGGALGGISQGFNGGSNTFLDGINKLIDRDIDAQKENYQRGRDTLKQRDTLFGQMLQASGDQRVAALQTRAGYIEAAQMQLKSQLMTASNPVIIANGEKAADGLQRMFDQTQAQLAAESARAARAQVAAMQAAQAKAEDKAFDRAERLEKLRLEGRKVDIEESKVRAENPKLSDEQKVSRELNAMLGSFGEGASKKAATGSAVGSQIAKLPTFVPGATGARENVQARDRYNTNVMTAMGALYKWRTGSPEPRSQEILHEMAKPYEILPTDNEEVATAKQKALKEELIKAASGAGGQPTMPASVQFTSKLRGE